MNDALFPKYHHRTKKIVYSQHGNVMYERWPTNEMVSDIKFAKKHKLHRTIQGMTIQLVSVLQTSHYG